MLRMIIIKIRIIITLLIIIRYGFAWFWHGFNMVLYGLFYGFGMDLACFSYKTFE